MGKDIKPTLENIVELSKVSLSLSGNPVLRDLTWKIRNGERWAIIGPNGSGKTTLLKIVNAYLRPSSGAASVLGERFGETDLRELRKKIGFVSSYMHDLIPSEQNVLDTVVAGKDSSSMLWKAPVEEDVRLARKLLRMVGCSKYEHKILHDLSQGERQKILIARALMVSPEMLVFDEPCAELDLRGRESFLSSLDEVAEGRNLTILYVTHRIDEIPKSFTHALLLRKGRVLAQGPIRSVLTSRNVSKCFDLPVKVKMSDGRFYAVVN